MIDRMKDIDETKLEERAEKTLLMMYRTIAHSDLEGNIDNDYDITVLYALRCVDVNRNRYNVVSKTDMIKLAKIIVGIYEYSPMILMDYVSIEEWSEALLKYMKENNLRYKKIASVSSKDLMNKIKHYVENRVYGEYIH